MCAPAITSLSQLIAEALAPLTLLDPSNVKQENGIAIDTTTGMAVSKQAALVSLYLLDLVNLPNKNDNDLRSTKSILEITTAALQRILTQIGDKLDKMPKTEVTGKDFDNALETLGKLEWYKIKSDLNLIFSIIYCN